MKLSKQTITMLVICLLMILLNLAARLFPSFIDFYIVHIFPVLSAFWSRLTGLLPFSLGEWLIIVGIVLVIAAVPGYLLLLLFTKKDARPKAARIYGKFYGWIFTVVFSLVTLHFTMLYQGTQLSESLGEVSYSSEEVLDVVRQLVDGANRESFHVARDNDGHFIMTDDLMTEAKHCMETLSHTTPQFKGYYPDAKPIYHSYFFSQEGLLGIYFPHTMEANYNPAVYPINLPVTICHEYTHLKGNIFEDEAGYYAFLACIGSDSADFRYSAYISALEWMNVDFGEDEAAWEAYYAIMDDLSVGARTDLYSFVPDDFWDIHEEQEVIPTDIVNDTANTVMDTSLKINGIPSGSQSYYGMTALLLHYYLDDDRTR